MMICMASDAIGGGGEVFASVHQFFRELLRSADARQEGAESQGENECLCSHDHAPRIWLTIASPALMARAVMVIVLLPQAVDAMAPPPGIKRFSWSCERQSASTTELLASLPMIVPPIMCLLWLNLGLILTSVAPIASPMRRGIGSE